MSDKMRDDFEQAYINEINKYRLDKNHDGNYVVDEVQDTWLIHQAATEKSTAKIAELQGRIDELVDLLSQSELMLKSLYDAINQMQVKEV